MRGVDNKRHWLIAFVAAGLLIMAGVNYLDYKTNQMMTLASSGLVGILELDGDPGTETNAPSLDPENESHTNEIGETGQGVGASPSAQEPVNVGGNGSQAEYKAAGNAPQSAPTGTKTEIELQEAQGKDQDQDVNADAEAATLAEKAKAYKLASSKLSAKEINALVQWSQGGFTQEEKESAKALFYSRFTAEEQQWILGLFRKYGN